MFMFTSYQQVVQVLHWIINNKFVTRKLEQLSDNYIGPNCHMSSWKEVFNSGIIVTHQYSNVKIWVVSELQGSCLHPFTLCCILSCKGVAIDIHKIHL
jgi:hypothetical protein